MENQLNQFLKSVNKIDSGVFWDQVVKKYVDSLKKVEKIMTHEMLTDEVNKRILLKISKFIEKSSTPEFHIAFVGAIKAGKSTLINSLLGANLASTAVTPETASLTKFKHSKGKNYVKLNFYTSAEWDKLWKSVVNSKADVFVEEFTTLGAEAEKRNWLDKNEIILEFTAVEELKEEIKKWTSSKKATHYFVKEVEVGLSDLDLPEGVVFVDTPGLDDPVQYRSDITRAYIDRANAVLVCVKSDALTGGELGTIYSVFANARYNPEKIYVVGTQLDTLNRPFENWKEQRVEWLKILKREDCYGSVQLAEKNIIAVAAYVKNLVRDFNSIEDGSEQDWELRTLGMKFKILDVAAEIGKLNDFSNIDTLVRILNDEIIAKHRELLVEGLAQEYKGLKEDIITKFNDVKENQQSIIEASKSNIEELRKKREESLKLLEENKSEEKAMKDLLKQIDIATTKRAEELFKTMKNLWRG